MINYLLEVTEAAEADIERHSLRLMRAAPEQEARWGKGLTDALASLSTLPYRCAVVAESAALAHAPVRRLRYGKYVITFIIIEPQAGDTQGIVRVLHVRHGAQGTEPQEELC